MPRMPLAAALFGRFDLRAAVTAELSGRNSLLPRRFDDDVLARDLDEVVKWAAPQVRRAAPPTQENVVLARKGWRGLRPLSVLSLTDRIAYRALVRLLAESLPDEVRSREANATFKAAPLQVVGARYVLQTDVASFFQYVDHEVLGDELLAQTGEEPAVEALLALLGGVAGRRVGIPQISTASDVLGDVYVDPVRRSLARSGLAVFRYADDFRVACPSLGAALAALEACDDAVRALGLTLNERKSWTFSRPSYQRSLDAFRQREAELFEGDGDADGSDLSALDSQYGDDPVAGAVDIETVLGLTGTDPAPLEDGDALAEDASPEDEDDRLVVRAAARALDLWVEEDEGHDAQSTQDAAITQSLLSRALPLLGRAGDSGPLDYVRAILTHEPALTPQVAEYLVSLAASDGASARSVRDALDDVVEQDVISPWQGMWLAHAAGALPRTRRPGRHIDWLESCVRDESPALAATAGMALGRRRRGDPTMLAGSLDRVGPAWRPLLLLGLALQDWERASASADGALDRILLASARPV